MMKASPIGPSCAQFFSVPRINTLVLAIMATFATQSAVGAITDSKTWNADDNHVDPISLKIKTGDPSTTKVVNLEATGFDLTVAKHQSDQALEANPGIILTLNAKNFTTEIFETNRPLNGFILRGTKATVNLTGNMNLAGGELNMSRSSTMQLTAQDMTLDSLKNDASEAHYTIKGHLNATTQILNTNGGTLEVNADTLEVGGAVQSYNTYVSALKDYPAEPLNTTTLSTRGDMLIHSIRFRSKGTFNLISKEGNISILHHGPSTWHDAVIYRHGEGLIQAKQGDVTIGTQGGEATMGMTVERAAKLKVEGNKVEVYGTVYSEDKAHLNIEAKGSFLVNENGTYNNQSFNVASAGVTEVHTPTLTARGSIYVEDEGSSLVLDTTEYRITGENEEPYVYVQGKGQLVLNAQNGGKIESRTPGEAKAYLYLKGGTVKLGGGTHRLDGWAYFTQDKQGNGAQLELLDPSQKGQTTLVVENYAEEKGLETPWTVYRSAFSVNGTTIDLSGLNGELRTRSTVGGENTYQGYADTRITNLTDAAALYVYNGGSLTLADGQYTIAGTMLAQGQGKEQPSSISAGQRGALAFYGDALAVNGAEIAFTLTPGSTWEGMGDDWLDIKEAAPEESISEDTSEATDAGAAVAASSEDEAQSGAATDTAEEGEGATSPVTLTHLAPFSSAEDSPVIVTESGKLSVTMSGGTWVSRGKSSFSTLAFETPKARSRAMLTSVVDLTRDAGGSIYVDTLQGTGGTFRLLFNSDHTQGNMLYFKTIENATDAHFTIDAVIPEGVDPASLEGLRFATTGRVDNPTLFTVESVDEGFNNIHYQVEHEAYDATNPDNADYNEGSAFKPGAQWVDTQFAEGLNWYLAKPIVEVSEGGQVVLGTARSLYWQSIELDRLNKRLGERRMSREGENGLWIRLRHSSLGTDTGNGDFSSSNTTYQVGYDYARHESDGQRLFGLAIDYRDGNTDYESIRGDGEANRVGLTAYTTWLGESGWYWDAVAKWGRLAHRFDIVNHSGKWVSGDFHNHAYGISLEVGRELAKDGSPWFFEPQAQLQYTRISGVDYWTNQGSLVEKNRLNSVVSRLGFRLGRHLGEDQSGEAYLKADWLREWSGKQRLRVTDKTTGPDGEEVRLNHQGNWFDVGLGFQHAIGRNTYAYIDAEYRFGNDLTRSWDFNAGWRWMFY